MTRISEELTRHALSAVPFLRRSLSIVVGAASLVSCHTSASLPPLTNGESESACWWTVLRTSLPRDSVAARFQRAYETLGFQNVVSTTMADTTRVVALPTLGSRSRARSRVVAFSAGDSTNFRFFVQELPSPSPREARQPSDASQSDDLESCSQIAHAAAIRWSTPTRSPNKEDSLEVWKDLSTAREEGIAFGIDSSDDRGPAAGIFPEFSGEVIFARNRGRLDILTRVHGPAIRVSGAVIDGPGGNAGEYYLFDSAGYALVRPSTRTFSVSSSSSNYNYEERRDGWPEAFEFRKAEVDTLSPITAPPPATVYRHLSVFWHLDLEQSPAIRVLARGRIILDEASIGQVSIARWFGAAAALAQMPGTARTLETSRLRITVVTVVPPEIKTTAATNLIALHKLTKPRIADIELAHLVVPNDYVETPWPGMKVAASSRIVGPHDQYSKWKMVP